MREFTPVKFTDVSVEGDFWRERLDTVLTRTIPSQHARLVEYGILDLLDVPQPPPPLRIPRNHHNFTTQIFWDSDVGKWIEAASYALQHRRDASIEAQIDKIAEQLARAQLPDGYLNCWYIGREADRRWTNLRDNHELYCAGHMLEGAVAYFQATGRRNLLDVMLRYVDHIAATFGTGDAGQKRGYCGHQEIELALVKLYGGDAASGSTSTLPPISSTSAAAGRTTSISRRRRAATTRRRSFKDLRIQPVAQAGARAGQGRRARGARDVHVCGDGRSRSRAWRRSCSKRACEVLWSDVTGKRMYVTAGLGPAAANEGFTTDYDLPNDTAYAETCASVALIFWAQRMLNLDLDGAYADVMELALYNGALSGLARNGTQYFYQNPLESDGSHTRWDWHPCPCCTMNVSRLVASIGGYFYSNGPRRGGCASLWRQQCARWSVGGTIVRIRQETDYPWSGRVKITLEPDASTAFALKLRVPGWARNAALSVNGAPLDDARLETMAMWRSVESGRQGDIVDLDLPMPVERVYANPRIKMDIGRVCLKRGPLVDCLEQIDNQGTIGMLKLPSEANVEAVTRA